MSLHLRGYQQPHFAKLLTSLQFNNFAHDGSETGTGKTYTGAALVKAFEEPTMVIAPLSVIPSWKEALEGFGAKNYVLTNYEKAWRQHGEIRKWGGGSFFKFTTPFRRLILDESHRAGGETTVNSKMLIAAKRQGAGILSLSATIAETPLRLKAFGFAAGLHSLSDYQDFLIKCNCTPATFGGWYFNAKKNPLILQGLQEEIYGKGLGSRMLKKDIPGFPQTVVSVKLLGSPQKQLVKMGQELLAYYNERTVAAIEMGAKAEKKKKWAEESGEEMEQSGEEMSRIMFLRQALETAKIPLIADLAEDALEHSKVVVFCNFKKTVRELCAIAEKRKWKFGVIEGGQTTGIGSERDHVIRSFQRNELDAVFCNVDAGAEAVSLHDPFTQYPRTALICPMYSGWRLKQVLGRVVRAEGGFSSQYLLYFEDSIEGQIARRVMAKLDALDLLNDGELSGDFKKAA